MKRPYKMYKNVYDSLGRKIGHAGLAITQCDEPKYAEYTTYGYFKDNGQADEVGRQLVAEGKAVDYQTWVE